MTLILRDYQREAIHAAYDWIREQRTNPCIVLPTGAGKTPVLATIAADVAIKWGGRALVVSHVKELIEQAADAMAEWFPEAATTVYSAGLGEKNPTGRVVCAGVQSIAERSADLNRFGPINVVLVDEAHMIPPGGTGRYRTLIEQLQELNPSLTVIGLTATPYRLDGGVIYGNDGELFAGVCYESKVGDLIRQGFLSNVSSKRASVEADLSRVSITNGEFDSGEMAEAFESIVRESVEQILRSAIDRRSVIVFCSGVDHALAVWSLLTKAGESAAIITGATPTGDRKDFAKRFKAGQIKYMVNVNVLTTGFDATCVDMVALLRATLSPGLFYQMVGRGLRLHGGKTLCRVLDFGGNVRRHGCIDDIQPPRKRGKKEFEERTRECPRCEEICKAILPVCPDCGLDFSWKKCLACGGFSPPDSAACVDCSVAFEKQEREITHDEEPDDVPILTTQIEAEWIEIDRVDYWVHKKRGADENAPRSMRVSYWSGFSIVAEEWVCVEHEGYPATKARSWWSRRSGNTMPTSAEFAVKLCCNGHAAEPKAIAIKERPGSKFVEIVGYRLGEKPMPVDEQWIEFSQVDDDEVPF